MRDVEVAPRDVVAACLPDPATLGDRMFGKTCAGTLGHGPARTASRGRSTSTTCVDNECVRCASTASQAVVWQTAINPVIALELLANGAWAGQRRARARRRSTPQPFLDLLAAYGSPHGVLEL